MNSTAAVRKMLGICFLLLGGALFFVRGEVNQIFIQQVAGLFCIAGVSFLYRNVVKTHRNAFAVGILLGIAALYSIPSWDTHPTFIILVTILLVASWGVFRIAGRTMIASFFGAFIFACSTWLPLNLIHSNSQQGILSLRDALLDPNQIVVSHAGGGYVGIPGAVFAIAGVALWLPMIVQGKLRRAREDSFVAALLACGLFITFVPSPIQYSQAIVLVVFCIAWFASRSLDAMQRFIGARDTFVHILLVLLTAIALLDLMNITTRTFSYGIGI